MNKIQPPNPEDIEVYQSGATYCRVHFVSKKMSNTSEFDALQIAALKYKAISCVNNAGVFNSMFRTMDEAKEFAASL